jgi:lipopolysaccharide transport system permease protein
VSTTADLLSEEEFTPTDGGDLCDSEAEPGAGSPAPPELIFERRTGWQFIDFAEIWRNRELLYFLTWRDVKVRYKQTLLGAAWAILQPLLMMVVFTIFFARMARVSSGGLPYPLFAFSGLLPWLFFASAITSAGGSVIGSERLVTKVFFPRLLIPFAAIGAAVVDFVIALGLLAVLMIIYGVAPGASLTLLPPVFGLILLAGLGVGTLLAALNVAYRDFKHVVPFLTQLWMFATPTVYLEPGSSSRSILYLNPMAALIAAFRAAVLGGPVPWGPLGAASASALAAFLIGCLYFRKVERRFADII